METRYTPSGVRMRLHSAREGALNWVLLPGGPGIGSESLHELADVLDVPGTIWLVDLPGDGSNTSHQPDPFALWPQVLIEAAEAVPDAVFVGHSTGGMYLLSTPRLRDCVRGLALLDTAPDCTWHAEYVEMTRNDPLPAFERAAAAYERDGSFENLTTLCVTSAEWNFTPAGLEAGRALLARMPYNSAAVQWSDANFDHSYKAAWWPTDIPVLRLWGDNDRIVSQRGWSDLAYNTPNLMAREIPDAGHFPWIENPSAVARAFREFASQLLASAETAFTEHRV
ncbi:alpha/beta hydrolase [Variovorax robiniae]|uniref:Alpha/beta hydrolase n=1 Tax=Variovorax robiniae TaxID=1836199 RepID=A0ABU8XGC0_9BURK